MEFYILNPELETVAIIDTYSSMIWTTKYNDFGDFELYIPATDELIANVKKDYIVIRSDRDTSMIIKAIKYETNEETGDYITLSGVSLEALLSQRIVWNLTTVSGRVSECIKELIRLNCTDGYRIIPNLVIKDNSEFTETYDGQFEGDNLLDAIIQICKNFKLGFKMRLTNSNTFEFSLYRGVDRSYSQDVNQWVVFSADYDNLLSSDYFLDITNHKNVACVGGDGEGLSRTYVSAGDASGLDRYETFVDAGNVSRDDATKYTDYTSVLKSKGEEALASQLPAERLEASVDADSYEYGVDYNLGDIVQITTKNGFTITPRITTITENYDETGFKLYPTWEVE